MPRTQPRWSYTFESSDRLRDAERDEGRNDCARGQWCAGRVVSLNEKGERVTSPAKTPRVFCDKCASIVGTSIADLPGLALKLTFEARHHVTAEQEIRLPFGPSIPLRVDAEWAAWMIADICASWHERVAFAARLVHPDTRVSWRQAQCSPASAAAASAQTLEAHVSTLLTLEEGPMGRWLPLLPLPDAPEVYSTARDAAVVMMSGAHAGNEILAAHYLARAILMETPPKLELLLGVPCRMCEKLTLRRADPPWNDSDPAYWSSCMSCRDVMTAEDYREWTVRNAAFYRHKLDLVTLAEVTSVA